MAGPTEKTIKRLFALSGNVCAFPGCSSLIVESAGLVMGEICHIRARERGGPRFDEDQTEENRHGFDNLLLLCCNHHKIVDTQPNLFPVETLQQMKAVREREGGSAERLEDGFFARILLRNLGRTEIHNQTDNVVINSPGAILAQTVNVRTSGKVVKVQPPAGTIGADPQASRYIAYLIGRYNKLASADRERDRKFSYGAISRTIEAKFGARWQLLDGADFEPLGAYLKHRISKTRLAKLNAAKGVRSFASFVEFIRSGARDA